MNHLPYSSRRQQLIEQLGDGVAIVPIAADIGRHLVRLGIGASTPLRPRTRPTSGASGVY